MKLKEKFLLLTRGKQIAVVVFAIHLFAIFSSFGHHLITRRLKPPRMIVVKTAAMKNAEVKEEVAKQAAAAAPQVKNQVAKPKVEKKVTAKPKPEAKKSGAVKADPIFKEVAEGLGGEVKSRPALSVPAKLQRREEAVVERVDDPTYSEFLIGFLQRTLDLPEFGEVKIKMEIDRFGNLIHCEILEAKSKKNGEYLQEQLPGLSFPCLADFGILESAHTFTIIFRNI